MEIEIVIEHEGHVSKFELMEIIDIIDSTIMDRLDYMYSPIDHPFFYRSSDVSFVQIRYAREGSLLLGVALGGLAMWAFSALAKGANRSRLGQRLEAMGERLGDMADDVISESQERINHYLAAKRPLDKLSRLKRVVIRRRDQDKG